MGIQSPDGSAVSPTWKILIIDDDEDDFYIACEMLKAARGRKFEVQWAKTYAAGRSELFSNPYHAVLVDYDLGTHTGIELIREANEQGCVAPIILYTGRGSYEVDMEAMQAGATLYLTKGETSALMLERAIRYAIERKQIETTLRASEARLQSVLGALVEGVVFLNAQGEVEASNEAIQRNFGHTIEELSDPQLDPRSRIVRPDGTLFPVDEQPAILAMRTGQVVRDVEMGVPTQDGKMSWRLVNAQPVYDDRGALLGAVASFFDITDRRRAEEALRQTAGELDRRTRELNAILSSVQDYVYIFDPEGCFVFANQRLLDLWGLTAGEAAGKAMRDLDYPEAVATVLLEGVRQVLATGQVVTNITDYTSPTGATGSFENILAPMHGPDGRVAFVAGSSRDITERKRAEEELRASEQKYRNLFENMAEEVHFWQIVRDEAGEIQTWRLIDGNPPALRTWGRASIDEIRGKTTDQIFGPGATEHYMPVVQKIMSEGVPYSFEDYFPNLDKYFRFTSVPFGEYFITTGADITSVKQAERATALANEQLQLQAEELEVQTEELQAQTEELVAANQKLIYQASLLGNISEAAISTDASFNILSWNRAAEMMYGWLAEEVLGKPSALFLRTEYLDGTSTADVVRQLEEQGFWKGEVRQHRKDGARIYVAASITNLKDSAGKITGVITINRDITEHKAAEEALRKNNEALRRSEEKFARSFRSSPVAIAISTVADGRFVEVNDSYTNLFGFSREELVGHTSIELGMFPDPRARQEIVRQFRACGGFQNYEIRLLTKSGDYRDMLFSTEQMEIDGQDCMLSLVVDITERKQAEQALRASENRLQKLVEGNIIGVDVRDAAGQLKDANSVFLKMVGYSCEDLQAGRLSIKNLTAPAFWPADQQAAAEALVSGACQPYEKAFIHKDGHFVPAMVGYTRLDDSGDEFIGFVLDLSELKQTQTALQDYMVKLKQSNQELEQFAFMASHDLKEPLRKISMFGNFLQQKLQGELDEETQDSFQRMLNASERMQAMIDDLLQLSRVNTEGRPFVPVDLSRVAVEVVSDLEPRILLAGGQVVVEALPCIEADPIQIHQVLQNLIGNALKFHKLDTPPFVKVSSTVTRSRAGKGEMVSIQIEDNGIGFEQQQFEQILQPFQRLYSRREYEGNGIGLAIVKKIVDRHHGEISARSTPGEGSTIIITLPVIQPSQSP